MCRVKGEFKCGHFGFVLPLPHNTGTTNNKNHVFLCSSKGHGKYLGRTGIICLFVHGKMITHKVIDFHTRGKYEIA